MSEASKDAPKEAFKEEAKPQDAPKSEEKKLSPAELKKQAKAEKQARRAAQKDTSGAPQPGPSAQTNGTHMGEVKAQGDRSQQQKQAQKQPQKGQQQRQGEASSSSSSAGHHARRPSQPQNMPLRRRPSQSGPSTTPKEPTKENKQVELFSHLYTHPRRTTLEGAPKDIHPAVLALGLQFSSYEICGSSARCVAMLLAFRLAIQSYSTPVGTSLARHMTSHFLSPQIDYLKTCRPISESMGNAIRFLKKLIVEIDPAVEEQEAKTYLCDQIDVFIRDRITVTDQAIAAAACHQIKRGAVVLTYAKSSLVEKTILQAHANGIRFRVIVIDSRPLFEGKNLARTLMRAGVEVEYTPLSGIAHAVREATVVLLGAHSMLSNGRLQSRVGTASVAMHAHKADIPVIVLCESVKFTGKVALDSIVLNEVAPSEELLLEAPSKSISQPAGAKDGDEEDEEGKGKVKALADWRDIKGLQILNLMYDVTPAEFIRMVVCEYGSLPPSSVPVVHRLANEGV